MELEDKGGFGFEAAVAAAAAAAVAVIADGVGAGGLMPCFAYVPIPTQPRGVPSRLLIQRRTMRLESTATRPRAVRMGYSTRHDLAIHVTCSVYKSSVRHVGSL